MVRSISGIDEMKDLVGVHLGFSDWHEVTQNQINLFADATGDHQWIHVDPVKAAAGPFGGPIAHGYLTLSMAPRLLSEVYHVEGVSMGVNYGLDRLRFPAPVPAGSRLRAGVAVADVTQVEGGVQTRLEVTFEVEGHAKPACVAEILFRLYR